MDNSLTNMGHAINFMAKAEWRENIGLTLDKCQILVQDLSITCPTTKLWQGLDMDKFLTNIGQALDKCQKFVHYLSITCHTTHSIPAPKNREGERRVAIENSKGGGEGDKADRFRPHTHGYNASNNMFVAIIYVWLSSIMRAEHAWMLPNVK